MKKISLIIFIVLVFLLFSCKGSPKTKDTKDKEIIDGTAKQANELTEKISADEQNVFEDLTVAGMEEPLDTEIAQADSDTEMPVDEMASLETEPVAAQELAAVTPPVEPSPAQTQSPVQPQTPSVQTPPQQPPPQTPPAQAQPQTLPAVVPPVENPAVSEAAPSDSDAQTKGESSSSIADNSAPAPRIESLIQMGTMPHDNEIVFSRIVRATVGQIVEIPFRGNGWVYLGEITSQRGIVHNSRRNDSDGQTFIFTLEEAGTYILKFYRQDFIRDYILNDHVQVVAGEAPTAGAGWFNPPVDRGRVVAQPRWPSPVEETQIRSGTKPASEPVVTTGTTTESEKGTSPAPNTAPQQRPVTERETNTPQRTTPAQETNTANRTPAPSANINPPIAPSAPSGQTAAPIAQTQIAPVTTAGQGGSENPSAEKKEILAPEVVAQKARESFDSGNISAAIALLDQFMADYPGGSDEVYWQLGQYYEANSPSRNILLSLDYYRRLINEYPQSRRFNDARRRIAYLERYYINIQ